MYQNLTKEEMLQMSREKTNQNNKTTN